MFVLNVDLWDEVAGQEVNLCRQPPSNGAPSIAAAPGFPYTPVNGADGAPVRYPSQGAPPGDMNYTQQPPPPPPPPQQQQQQQQPLGYVQDYSATHGYAQGTTLA